MRSKIQSLVDDYAASVIKAVMAEHMIGIKDFHSSGKPVHIVRARVAAIKQLKADGLGPSAIARAMEMDRTAIEYHLLPTRKRRYVRRGQPAA